MRETLDLLKTLANLDDTANTKESFGSTMTSFKP
jgi:hypothetical protein